MSEWIEVEDQLPDYETEVLIAYWNAANGPFVSAAQAIEDHGWVDMSENDLNHLRVTHWMPLPDPPAPRSTGETEGEKP